MRKQLLPLLIATTLLAIPSRAWSYGVTWRQLYDVANQKLNGGDGYKTADNASGTLAWGESYVMMSYATMYRATGEARYLRSLADHALHVLDGRDSARGLKDYAGHSRSCWQSSKYSADHKGYCWVVHSGMIAYPIADLLLLLKANPALEHLSLPAPNAGKTLGQVKGQLLAAVEATVATHDFQWVPGPQSGEGHYRGDPAATSTAPTVAGKALPLNQMNAMGRLLVVLWKITGKAAYRDKAQSLATYLKNRMTLNDRAYVWTYWGTPWSTGAGEDISHAAINTDFAALCHEHGLVFTQTDMQRLGRTLFDKVHIDTNTTADRVDGSGTTGSYTAQVGRWLTLSPYEPRVWAVAANILRFTKNQSLLGLANLARFAPPLRHFSFYSADWSDQGTYKKATAYGANILLNPQNPNIPYTLKIAYRADKRTWVDQWDGKAYHHGIRLAPTSGSGFTWAYAPYDPAIYHAYTGASALYQFTDAFVSGHGIEVKDPQPTEAPQILTTSAPAAAAELPYTLALKGKGDAPLRWHLMSAPAGMAINTLSGVLAWTPARSDAPQQTFTVRLSNDSGEDTQTLTIAVTVPSEDAGPSPDDGSPTREGGATTDLLLHPNDGATSDSITEQSDDAMIQGEASLPPDQDAIKEGCACTLVGNHSNPRSPSLPAWIFALLSIALIRSRRRGPRS